MIKQRKGSIVCMGSDLGKMAPAGEVMYASAKAAIMTFASSLSKEIGIVAQWQQLIHRIEPCWQTPGRPSA
jgi:short-subunit dehydrogenase